MTTPSLPFESSPLENRFGPEKKSEKSKNKDLLGWKKNLKNLNKVGERIQKQIYIGVKNGIKNLKSPKRRWKTTIQQWDLDYRDKKVGGKNGKRKQEQTMFNDPFASNHKNSQSLKDSQSLHIIAQPILIFKTLLRFFLSPKLSQNSNLT